MVVSVAFVKRANASNIPFTDGAFFQQGEILRTRLRPHTRLKNADQRSYHSCFTGERERRSVQSLPLFQFNSLKRNDLTDVMDCPSFILVCRTSLA